MGSHTIPGVADPHGAAQHTDVTRGLFLPANEGYVTLGTPDELGMYGVVDGGADANEPSIHFTMKVPDVFVSFSSVKAVWSSGIVAGNMYWRLEAHYCAPGEQYTTHFDNPGLGVTATGGVNLFNVQEPENPLTLANLAIGDYLGIFFQRLGADVLDTLGPQEARILGLLFTYVANQ